MVGRLSAYVRWPYDREEPGSPPCVAAPARERDDDFFPPSLPAGSHSAQASRGSRALVAATYAGADFAAALANGNANATQSRGALSRMPEAAKLTGKEGG